MRGIRGISERLDRLLEPLDTRDLPRIVDMALGVTLEEYRRDSDIRGAIEAYRADPIAARALADNVSNLSKRCDGKYARLEDAGDIKRSDDEFRKMCVLNGIYILLSADALSPQVVDDLIYDLGHGASDADRFAERMIQKLRTSAG